MYGENTQYYYLQLLLASTNRYFNLCNVPGGAMVWENIELLLAIMCIPFAIAQRLLNPAIITVMLFVFGFLVAAMYVALKLCHAG